MFHSIVHIFPSLSSSSIIIIPIVQAQDRVEQGLIATSAEAASFSMGTCSRISSVAIAVVILALICALAVRAMDRSKFHTCTQVDYCSRLRPEQARRLSLSATAATTPPPPPPPSPSPPTSPVNESDSNQTRSNASDGTAVPTEFYWTMNMGTNIEKSATGFRAKIQKMSRNSQTGSSPTGEDAELRCEMVHGGKALRVRIVPLEKRDQLDIDFAREFFLQPDFNQNQTPHHVEISIHDDQVQILLTAAAAAAAAAAMPNRQLPHRNARIWSIHVAHNPHLVMKISQPDSAKKDSSESTSTSQLTINARGLLEITRPSAANQAPIRFDVSIQSDHASSSSSSSPSCNWIGLPERAMPFFLQPTVGSSNSDPLRIFNLDIFEYDLNATIGLYGAVPFLISIPDDGTRSDKWGMVFANPSETWVDLSSNSASGSDSDCGVGVISEWAPLDLFIFHSAPSSGASGRSSNQNSMVRLVRDFSDLFGGTPTRSGMGPRSAYMYHQCRWNYKDQEDIMSVSDQFDKHNIPVDFLWLDIEHTDEKKYFTWDHTKFPNPKEMQESLGSFGRKMVTITDPHIKRKSGFHIHDQAVSNHLYVKKSRESPNEDFQGQCWSGDSGWLDFFNKKVRDFYSEQFLFEKYQHSTRHLHNWIDMNEPSVFSGPEITMPRNALHTLTTNDNQKGLTTRQVEHGMVHNLYGFLHIVSSMRGLKSRFLPKQATPGASRSVPTERSFLLSRSFFLGLPGANAFIDQDPSVTNPNAGGALAIWTGDNAAKWEHLEMSIDMLLTLSLTGIGFSGADVGGFFGNPTEDLLVRWYQVGAFYPFFRAHAHIETKRREPYLFDEVTRDQIRTAIQSRYILAPYWYTLFADWCAAYLPPPSNRSHDEVISMATPIGLSPMRHLLVHYDGQIPLSLVRGSLDARMHFLIGKDLLVRAIAQPGLNEALVFLPGRGELWFDYYSGLRIDQGTIRAEDGGKWITVPVTMKQIPVFQRGGSVVPKKERARRTSELMRNDPYTLQIALDANGNATGFLYDDDGFTFEYLDGHFIRRRFEMRSARVLSNLDARPASAQSNSKFHTPCVVERIVIFGFTRKPSSVRLQSHTRSPSSQQRMTIDAKHGSVADPAVSGTVQLERVFDFEYEAPSQRLVIRRPWLPIDEQWSILIE